MSETKPSILRSGISMEVKLTQKPITDWRSQAIVAGRLWRQQNELQLREETILEKDKKINELMHDTLTGLPGLHMLQAELPLFLQRTHLTGRRIGLAFVDVKNFKKVNDTYGHNTGDDYLVEVASGLREATRPGDRAYRKSGDEFIMLLDGDIVLDDSEVPQAANGIKDRIKFHVNRKLSIFESSEGVNVGVAFSDPYEGAESLIARADAEMYLDKAVPTETLE